MKKEKKTIYNQIIADKIEIGTITPDIVVTDEMVEFLGPVLELLIKHFTPPQLKDKEDICQKK